MSEEIKAALARVKETIPPPGANHLEWPYGVGDTVRRIVALLEIMAGETPDAR
jgi:hypothetical protein